MPATGIGHQCRWSIASIGPRRDEAGKVRAARARPLRPASGVVAPGARRLGPTEPGGVLEADVAERPLVQRRHLPLRPADAVLVRDPAREPLPPGGSGSGLRGGSLQRRAPDQQAGHGAFLRSSGRAIARLSGRIRPPCCGRVPIAGTPCFDRRCRTGWDGGGLAADRSGRFGATRTAAVGFFDVRQERRTEGGQPLAPQRLALFVRRQLARSLRAIAVELARLGHLAPSGKPYEVTSVKRMLER
jgi:hypothetical protein